MSGPRGCRGGVENGWTLGRGGFLLRRMKLSRTTLTALAVLLTTLPALALERRSWLTIEGRSFEGELQKVFGNQVTILETGGKPAQFDRATLSLGDNDYIRENFPDPKIAGFASTAGTPAHVPQPAKTVKIDPKSFKLGAGTFVLPTDTFDMMETPHFKVMYQKPLDPHDMGELAERMWLDAAFFHTGFPKKFGSNKMAIFLATGYNQYDRIGQWYADQMTKAGQQEIAAKIAATWPRSASGSMNLTEEIMGKNAVVQHARVFRAYREPAAAGQKAEMIRGVWTPFFVHCLAEDLLAVNVVGIANTGEKGWYAISTGHAYHKEINLTGKTETNLVRTQSAIAKDVSTIGGFQDAKNWAPELKKLIRKGEVKPTLETLYVLTLEGSDAKGNVLAYAWSCYLESSMTKLAAFNKLIEQVGAANKVPEPAELAKTFGFDSVSAMEADFMKFLTSADFR